MYSIMKFTNPQICYGGESTGGGGDGGGDGGAGRSYGDVNAGGGAATSAGRARASQLRDEANAQREQQRRAPERDREREESDQRARDVETAAAFANMQAELSSRQNQGLELEMFNPESFSRPVENDPRGAGDGFGKDLLRNSPVNAIDNIRAVADPKFKQVTYNASGNQPTYDGIDTDLSSIQSLIDNKLVQQSDVDRSTRRSRDAIAKIASNEARSKADGIQRFAALKANQKDLADLEILRSGGLTPELAAINNKTDMGSRIVDSGGNQVLLGGQQGAVGRSSIQDRIKEYNTSRDQYQRNFMRNLPQGGGMGGVTGKAADIDSSMFSGSAYQPGKRNPFGSSTQGDIDRDGDGINDFTGSYYSPTNVTLEDYNQGKFTTLPAAAGQEGSLSLARYAQQKDIDNMSKFSNDNAGSADFYKNLQNTNSLMGNAGATSDQIAEYNNYIQNDPEISLANMGLGLATSALDEISDATNRGIMERLIQQGDFETSGLFGTGMFKSMFQNPKTTNYVPVMDKDGLVIGSLALDKDGKALGYRGQKTDDPRVNPGQASSEDVKKYASNSKGEVNVGGASDNENDNPVVEDPVTPPVECPEGYIYDDETEACVIDPFQQPFPDAPDGGTGVPLPAPNYTPQQPLGTSTLPGLFPTQQPAFIMPTPSVQPITVGSQNPAGLSSLRRT